MAKFLSVICLAVVLPGAAHAQFSYDDFLRNVEQGASSPRVAQANSQESSLPVPSDQQPSKAPAAKPAEAPAAKPAAQVPSLNVPQPAPVKPAPAPQPVPLTPSAPVAPSPSPGVVNFDQLFADEQFGLSTGLAVAVNRPAGHALAIHAAADARAALAIVLRWRTTNLNYHHHQRFAATSMPRHALQISGTTTHVKLAKSVQSFSNEWPPQHVGPVTTSEHRILLSWLAVRKFFLKKIANCRLKIQT